MLNDYLFYTYIHQMFFLPSLVHILINMKKKWQNLQVSGKPIKFVGQGERIEDLEPFYPDRMAQRILGMGDVLSFVEKAQDVVSHLWNVFLSCLLLDYNYNLIFYGITCLYK